MRILEELGSIGAGGTRVPLSDVCADGLGGVHELIDESSTAGMGAYSWKVLLYQIAEVEGKPICWQAPYRILAHDSGHMRGSPRRKAIRFVHDDRVTRSRSRLLIILTGG